MSATSAKCNSGKLKGTRWIWSAHGGTPGCRHTNDLAVKLRESLEVSHGASSDDAPALCEGNYAAGCMEV